MGWGVFDRGCRAARRKTGPEGRGPLGASIDYADLRDAFVGSDSITSGHGIEAAAARATEHQRTGDKALAFGGELFQVGQVERGEDASPHLEGWLRADIARALGRPRSAIHGCRSLLGCDVKEITGSPDPKHISTSYVERQNLTMRMSMRRFTRLTNAFSKKAETRATEHPAAIALYFMYYNFAPVHQTLRVTPAMEGGIADHVWPIENIVALLD